MSTIVWENTLSQKVKKYAVTQPEKIAVVANSSPITYAQLENLTAICRGSLKDMGAKRGDCIVVSAVMKAEYIAAYLAVKSLRMIFVPINKTATESEALDIVQRVKAKIILTDNPRYKNISGWTSLVKCCHEGEKYKDSENMTPDIEQEHAETGINNMVPAEEVTEILFTSGTTGKPKGVMLSQGGIIASIKNTATGMKMQQEDILLLPLPLNHSFGLRVLRSALYQGETVVLQNGFTFAGEIVKKIENWHCNCMAIVNAGFEMVQQQLGDEYKNVFKNMRYVEFGAGAVPALKREKLVRELPNVHLYNTWGTTETGGGLFLDFSVMPDKINSAGKGINDIETAIIGEDGKVLSTGKYGRLVLKSSALLIGYFNDLELTKATIHDGWIWTNDLAMKDEDGYIYINGRVDDIISVGGEKIVPGNIERIIGELDFVKECVCLGVEDPEGILGQVPVVFWIADGEVDAPERKIKELILARGGSIMVPKAIIKTDKFPKNYMGKLDRNQLREIYKNSLHTCGQETVDKDSFLKNFMDLIVTRRSIRNFTNQHVEKSKIDNILLAGRMAPSGHNMQTWRFTVISDLAEIQLMKETTKTVAEREQTSFYGFNNPQNIIITSNDRRNDDASADSAAAIENMLLTAHAQGLGGCWINSWIKICDQPEIRKLMDKYKIPQNHIVYGIVGIGYYDTTVKVPVKKDNVIYFYGKHNI